MSLNTAILVDETRPAAAPEPLPDVGTFGKSDPIAELWDDLDAFARLRQDQERVVQMKSRQRFD